MCASALQPCLTCYYICFSLSSTLFLFQLTGELLVLLKALLELVFLPWTPWAESGVPYTLAQQSMLMWHLSIYHTTSVSSFSIAPTRLGDARCVPIVYFPIVDNKIKKYYGKKWKNEWKSSSRLIQKNLSSEDSIGRVSKVVPRSMQGSLDDEEMSPTLPPSRDSLELLERCLLTRSTPNS